MKYNCKHDHETKLYIKSSQGEPTNGGAESLFPNYQPKSGQFSTQWHVTVFIPQTLDAHQ